MSYLSLSDKDKAEMLARAGAGSIDDLFGCIPEAIRLKRPLDLPPAQSEIELVRSVEAIGRKNDGPALLSFLGGGAYEHFIPTVVDYLTSRGEFLSPYTPYQPEVSQGTLQAVFEFQTLVCQLTGLDIANDSLYDGSTGAAEAVLMAQRITGRNKVLVAGSIHPQYRDVIRTYIRNLGIEAVEIGFGPDGRLDRDALAGALDDKTAAVVCQSPNFFGIIEDVRALSEAAHAVKALSVAVVAEALSLGLLEAPGKLGADIVSGEAQSLGLPVSFGGPYLGFMACRKEFLRQMPGRITGQTVDRDGRRGFVLTLSTREQHIRRERATSNICSNEALCALRATVFMETLGKQGLREMAWQNAQKAAYAADRLAAVKGVKRKFSGPVFNEFAIELPRPWAAVDAGLRARGIIGGYGLEAAYPGLGNAALVCVTELRTKDEIDRLVRALQEVLS
ncbi:MAG TPA: aminomethyl-transferring glycine dehydrogenase subunit GcvPA [Candidatus Aminicenantes bacterium]|nr:aminomethyl-transferring glycine dehydrogenase subunit GcvPA [Candidatus Aminicenantes bacterium]HRY65365.1 aminomethyl-transferring glycine dehydrogenase subunit GcvPA [Candidatus Aminicenantes bacterium]HRZ72167.1 aminomethyl-transferring glycine dehydrogenase subunit GcvPA [Candidatus Aminicenantes bacterium]